MPSDAAYFSRRANQERAAASKAACASAREAHFQMARRYDDLAAAIGARELEEPVRATA